MLKFTLYAKYATPHKFRQPKSIRLTQPMEKRLVKQSFSPKKTAGSVVTYSGLENTTKIELQKTPAFYLCINLTKDHKVKKTSKPSLNGPTQ